ncbi:MAG: tetratricopeptide repeat protein [Ignavibacteriota bacterium]|jgi:pentatricopeptide repeat protein|nr:tetratricopeptide repeat protein [Ignavibacteriales bacterium]MBL1121644.1 outer membrane protein assembly factor BamD [Ignavibacteriota bacterium]MCE7858046.1 outer membrane protein assembly factor BamD [Ignavibacteria bacterium CHB3]MCL4279327.1 tetratricopeptide repeat protein [Ignavibacteriaceae bacterium]MEB2296933.1 tetratricopeptide repeat protein [Ignavibacteria bacterium]
MKSFIVLLSLFFIIGCSSKKSDKELFDEAQQNLKLDKIPEAVIAFEEIVNDHSDSELAPEALSQLAGLYQNKLIKSLSEKENLEKAIELFKKLHSDYPKSTFAPSGLFMAGFINANELQNYDEATKLYKQFLVEYPNDELAASAQAELDNMGLSPEEILMKNMAKEK